MSKEKRLFGPVKMDHTNQPRTCEWTKETSQLYAEVNAALKPIMEKWMVDGYSPREVSHVMVGTAMGLESELIVMAGVKARRAAKIEIDRINKKE